MFPVPLKKLRNIKNNYPFFEFGGFFEGLANN